MFVADKRKRHVLHVREPVFQPVAGNSHLAVGEAMPDGTVYAGMSPDTDRPLFAAAMDAPRLMTWDDAMAYAAQVLLHGRRDWRLPGKKELALLCRSAAVMDGFNKSGIAAEGWYWSATPHRYGMAWSRRFSDGFNDSDSTLSLMSVRLVRG
jgi:hypothetical protein